MAVLLRDAAQRRVQPRCGVHARVGLQLGADREARRDLRNQRAD
jgi:hypothetical protein